MTVRLLDVNILVSLLDSVHIHHQAANIWFQTVAALEGWATSPITENGFIRIVSSVNYPNLRLTPAMAAESLALFKTSFPSSHHFWPDQISLADSALFDLTVLTSARQTTDAYLAGLAFHYDGRLVTLDRGIRWQAVRGATRDLVENIIP